MKPFIDGVAEYIALHSVATIDQVWELFKIADFRRINLIRVCEGYNRWGVAGYHRRVIMGEVDLYESL